MIREQPRLYGEDDLPWIATIVDEVVAARGEPWRVLRERLEHIAIDAPPRPSATLRTPAKPGFAITGPRVEAILGALRRVSGGRGARTSIARRIRASVLGPPALDAESRAARLDAAAAAMGMARDDLASLLWVDLAEERPVTLPDGRPDERRLAAYANLERIQRLVRRARTLRLRVWGDAVPLVRAITRYGLLATITVAGDATVLDVVGPLSLFHATTVYGRALSGLVPLLAEITRFELEILWDIGLGPTMLYLASPILLPPVPLARQAPRLAARLARTLSKTMRVELDPPPIAHGDAAHPGKAGVCLFPELLVEHAGRRVYIELVGFATAEYLAGKLARYRAAGIADVVLCIDDARAEPTRAGEPREVLRYAKRLTAETLVAHLER